MNNYKHLEYYCRRMRASGRVLQMLLRPVEIASKRVRNTGKHSRSIPEAFPKKVRSIVRVGRIKAWVENSAFKTV